MAKSDCVYQGKQKDATGASEIPFFPSEIWMLLLFRFSILFDIDYALKTNGTSKEYSSKSKAIRNGNRWVIKGVPVTLDLVCLNVYFTFRQFNEKAKVAN